MRALNRFFRWCVDEDERSDNPMDHIGPHRIPDEILPHDSEQNIETVLSPPGTKADTICGIAPLSCSCTTQAFGRLIMTSCQRRWL